MDDCFVNLHRLHYRTENGVVTVESDIEHEDCHQCNRLRENLNSKRKYSDHLNIRVQYQSQNEFNHGACSSHRSDHHHMGNHNRDRDRNRNRETSSFNIGDCYVNLHRIQFDEGNLQLPANLSEWENCTRCTIQEGSCMKRRRRGKGIAYDFIKFFEFSNAAHDGDLDAIKKFLSDGLLLKMPEYRGWTVMHTCIFANRPEALSVILNHNPVSKSYLSNLCIWEGSSLLYLSILRDGTSTEIIKTLLESGADPNKCTNEGFSPLHLACYKKRSVELVKLLVDHGADVNAREAKIGYTPLHFAIDVDVDVDLLEYLIDVCDVNVKDFLSITPLYEACVSNFLEAVRLILRKDTESVNVAPISEILPLSAAASTGNLELVQLLLQSGADTGAVGRAKVHCTLAEPDFLPLHSSLKNIEVFKLLLNHTEPHAISERFISLPIFVIVYAPSIDFIEALLEQKFPSEFEYIKEPGYQEFMGFLFNIPDKTDAEKYEKFLLFFKYYYHFDPEEVFNLIANTASDMELVEKCKYLHILLRLGLSMTEISWAKQKVIRTLNSYKETLVDDKIAAETISKLNEPVLTLMQLSRNAYRRYVRSVEVQKNVLAYKLIRDSCLPMVLKKYLWCQILD